MEPKTVYIVLDGSYHEERPVAAFSDRQRAEDYATAIGFAPGDLPYIVYSLDVDVLDAEQKARWLRLEAAKAK